MVELQGSLDFGAGIEGQMGIEKLLPILGYSNWQQLRSIVNLVIQV